MLEQENHELKQKVAELRELLANAQQQLEHRERIGEFPWALIVLNMPSLANLSAESSALHAEWLQKQAEAESLRRQMDANPAAQRCTAYRKETNEPLEFNCGRVD